MNLLEMWTQMGWFAKGIAYVLFFMSLAEVWHGASRRTWLLARAAAAWAILFPILMWLFKAPLCWVVGVERAYENLPACVGNPGNLVVTTRVLSIAIILGVAVVLVGWQLLRLDRPHADGRANPRRRLVALVATAMVAAAVLAVVPGLVGDAVLISVEGLRSELIALVALVPLALAASFVLTARDARRFVAGTLIAAVTFFVILYPNISALPLPARGRQRLPGPAADLPVSVPVPRQHRSRSPGANRVAGARPALRVAPGGGGRRRLFRVGVAGRAGRTGSGAAGRGHGSERRELTPRRVVGRPNMYWRAGQRILSAGRIIASNPLLEAVYIGNFSCGPDSFILKFFEEEMAGKSYLHLELDAHSADAGAVTRCEAFLDSIKNRGSAAMNTAA